MEREPRFKALVPFIVFMLFFCGCHTVDFGCKMAAVHSNHDSMVRIFHQEYAKESERKYIEENPERAAYFYRILAISETFRGNKAEAQKAFDKSLSFADDPMTHFHMAKFSLRERDIENAQKQIKSMQKAIEKNIVYDVNYYDFLLTGLTNWQQHKELMEKKVKIIDFYKERCNFLKKELENVRKMPPDILPALHKIRLKNAEKIRYGILWHGIERELGTPEWKHEYIWGSNRYFYPISDKTAVCFVVSYKTGKLGDIIFCRWPLKKVMRNHKVAEWIFLPNSVYAIQWRI